MRPAGTPVSAATTDRHDESNESRVQSERVREIEWPDDERRHHHRRNQDAHDETATHYGIAEQR